LNDAELKRWWDRNSSWFIPVACLVGLMTVSGIIALTSTFLFSTVKSAEVYQLAVSRARNRPEVVQALGTPVQEGLVTTGGIDPGRASLTVPLYGPRDRGSLLVEARKTNGAWSFSRLTLRIDRTKACIDLLAGTSGPSEPSR
jgi:hypothetical protein